MTLYVNEPKYDGMGVDAKRPASLRDKLTDRGWVECEGSYTHDRPCDCVYGLVPPEGMIVATADALAKATFDHQWVQGRGLEWWNAIYEQVTTALIAAARWERERERS